jgi:uncharacterized protein (DUF2336 family)
MHDSYRLYHLAQDERPRARLELTSAVSGLLDIDLAPREEELLSDVLIALLRQAESDLRQALAERLAVQADAPLRLVLHLANDEISIAAPILRRSATLSDLDLIYIIRARGAAYWQQIAQRERLSDSLINTLVECRDRETAIKLTENERIVLTRHAVEILTEMGKTSEALAKPLLARPEMPDDLAKALYAHVGAELKAYIRSHYDGKKSQAEAELQDLILEFIDTPQNEWLPSEEAMRAAARRAQSGMLSQKLMIETVKRGQIASFVALFAQYIGLKPDAVLTLLQDEEARNLAVVCRAHGFQKSEFSTIYMLTQRVRTGDRMVNPQDLLKAMNTFNKIRPEVAQAMLEQVYKTITPPSGRS